MPHIYRNYVDPLSFPSRLCGDSGCRVVWRVPKGVPVIPTSIKVVNLSFTSPAPNNHFNSGYGVYEPLSYILIRTANGQEISECRNPAELARVLNCCGVTNDYIDGVQALENGAALSMSIDTATQLQTFRRALSERLCVNQGLYKIELDKLLPVMHAMDDVMTCGFEIVMEFGNEFKYAAGTSINSIVLQYDELQDYKHTSKASKVVFKEWLPEKLYWVGAPTNGGMNTNQLRFLTYYGRSIDRMLMYTTDAADNNPILLSGDQAQAATQSAAMNLFLNGQQYLPLLGLTAGQYQIRKAAEFLGGMVFPYNHLINAADNVTDSDEPSVKDVLTGFTTPEGFNNSDAVLNVAVHKLNGFRIKDLVLQLTGYNSANEENNLFPNLNIYCWGECLKVGHFNTNGDFECEFA